MKVNYILTSCKLPGEFAVLLHHAFGLFLKLLCGEVAPPVVHVPIFVEVTTYRSEECVRKQQAGVLFLHPSTFGDI